ncbi:predicted protein [Pyrenophora tritici-repentis Pt-1C-BFP]|uniref:Uncharacterized protein n=1 Tax=Pyrenophora tritici-repentis (strain Pt-1C-BFP) TaxID=426418 RepID=B2W077_PYRTR|nr:uncharacterized protein PTRG_03067 [Pyrenophora tritici-repentis Pt-1C-BFP]EDU45590.1 predicted protein [Pyrenophora tritici-repentis Pt-1C-BFP]
MAADKRVRSGYMVFIVTEVIPKGQNMARKGNGIWSRLPLGLDPPVEILA